MTIRELITELGKWPDDATVVKSVDDGDFRDILSVDEWTAYNQFRVVID